MTYVSRAGYKLCYALDKFNVSVEKKICADLGSNVGGFVDCLLENNAKKVYAVETGYGILDWNLRNNENVIVMERTNALHVEIPEKVDFVSVDVSWTPQKLIIPKAISLLKDKGDIISLLKPHYEAEKYMLTKGVLEEKFLNQVIDKVQEDYKDLKINVIDIIPSPIKGKSGGNKEYLVHIKI